MEEIFGEDACCIIGIIVFFIAVAIFYAFVIIDDKRAKAQKTLPQQSNQTSRFCTQCGKQIPIDAKICPYCGHNF